MLGQKTEGLLKVCVFISISHNAYVRAHVRACVYVYMIISGRRSFGEG